MIAHFVESFFKSIDLLSLAELARTLLANGPHKLEKTSRRVRALFDRLYVFDTTEYVSSELGFPRVDLSLVVGSLSLVMFNGPMYSLDDGS